MKITYFGTTMLLLDDGKDQVLFDCHVTRPSMFTCLFGKLSTDRDVAERVIQTFDFSRLKGIFISHSHHDHILDAPYFAVKLNTALYGSPSALNVARGGGVSEEKLNSYVDSMCYTIGEFRITILPSVHSRAHWYNNDLGKTIDRPVYQPARKSAFKEGGSFDFLIEHTGKKYLIRPSYNFLEGQLDSIEADVLLLGVGGLSTDTEEHRKRFFEETIAKVHPQTVIPIHWDHFFTPLFAEVKGIKNRLENTGMSMHMLAQYCAQNQIDCLVQIPLTSIDL